MLNLIFYQIVIMVTLIAALFLFVMIHDVITMRSKRR